MSDDKRPLSPEKAPDAASTYERAKPHKEAGMGQLHHNPDATPTPRPDQLDGAVPNKQDPTRQINGEDAAAPAKGKQG